MSLRQKIYNCVSTLTFIIQRLRLWSRSGLVLYLILLHQLVFWVFGIPDITTAQTIIVSVITALATPIMAFYIKTGKGLYEQYVTMEYRSKFTSVIDDVGFIIDKLRLFPLFLLMYYFFLLYCSIMWGMDLGGGLSVAQATFISTFSGSASLIFGFFVTTGEVNMKMEEVYTRRYKITPTHKDNSNAIDETISNFEQEMKDFDKDH